MICPRCSVAEISPTSGACELCGFVPSGSVAVDAALPDATDELARAQLAHQFRIDVLLGQGTATAVYLAREMDSNRHIILKVLPRIAGRPDLDARFRDAIGAAATLEHPNLVPVIRHGETDSLLWYSMEHRRARPLRDILRTGGRLDHRTCLRYVTQVAGALDYLHRRGAIHGRLKPENVLVDAEGWVYLCDALVSRVIHGMPAAPGRAPEPPSAAAYMAPEESLGGGVAGPASDQYALAAIIHECLAGAVPPPAGPAHPAPTLTARRPDLPAHVGHAVARALSPRPNDRYPGVLDFVTALESGVSLMVDARPSGRASDVILTNPDWKPPPKERPRWLVPSLVSVTMMALAATAFVLIQQARQDRRPAPARPPVAPAAAPAAPDTAAAAPAAPRAEQLRTQIRRTEVPPPGVVELRPRRQDRREGASPPRTRIATPDPAPTRATPAPAEPAGEPGRLFVNATPWGQLYLDGQLVGNTPKANLSVAAGTHTIRVVREGYEPVERTIRVGPGEAVRLTDLVLTPRP